MDGVAMSAMAGCEYLVTLRRLADMRQEDLASAVKMTPRTVNRWENGRSRPSPKITRQLMKVLRGSVDSFLELWDDPVATREDAVARASSDREEALLLEAIKTDDDWETLIRAYHRRRGHG